jgi:hypothetical protein
MEQSRNFLAGGDEELRTQTPEHKLLTQNEKTRTRYLYACEEAMYGELVWDEWID